MPPPDVPEAIIDDQSFMNAGGKGATLDVSKDELRPDEEVPF